MWSERIRGLAVGRLVPIYCRCCQRLRNRRDHDRGLVKDFFQSGGGKTGKGLRSELREPKEGKGHLPGFSGGQD